MSGIRHLTSVRGLTRADYDWLMDTAHNFAEVARRRVRKAPVLKGKTVVTLFFENSTRTRTSFEVAANMLSADVVNFSPGTSSLSKGESLKDTLYTIEALGGNLIVVRHPSPGIADLFARWSNLPIINGGDGIHEHPTQALLDHHLLREEFGKLDGLRVCIMGDILHSRVARSHLFAYGQLGVQATIVAPPTLIPAGVERYAHRISWRMTDDLLRTVDVVYLLRIQQERQGKGYIPSIGEYFNLYGLRLEQVLKVNPNLKILHPGPINRNVEIDEAAADWENTLILDQVRNGVPMRMAILYWLLAGGAPQSEREDAHADTP